MGFQAGVRESAQSWRELLACLRGRGLTIGPELAIGAGALGFWKALEEIFPDTRRQRCWVHKTANVLNKLAKSRQTAAKAAIWADGAAPPTRRDQQFAIPPLNPSPRATSLRLGLPGGWPATTATIVGRRGIRAGRTFDMGPSALLDCDGMGVVVTSKRQIAPKPSPA